MLLFLMIIGVKLETVLLFLQKYVYSKIHLTANKPMTINYFYALTIFHHVANTNSFTATASQLGLAVSSVTRQIDNLEQSLQVKLLNRSTRHLDLTHAGMRYLQQTEPILAELQQVNEAIKEEQIEPQGRLCLTFPSAYGIEKIAPLLAEFAHLYPKIELELFASDEFVDLFNEKYDVGVRLGRVEDDRLVAKFIASQQRLLCASPDYLRLHGTPQIPSQLAEHNCLPFMYQGHASKWYFHQTGKTQSLRVTGNLMGNNIEMLKQATLDGQGISHLPNWLIEKALQSGALVQVLSDWQVTPSLATDDGIYLVYPPTSRNVVKIGVLVNFLAQRLIG